MPRWLKLVLWIGLAVLVASVIWLILELPA